MKDIHVDLGMSKHCPPTKVHPLSTASARLGPFFPPVNGWLQIKLRFVLSLLEAEEIASKDSNPFYADLQSLCSSLPRI